MCRSTIAGSPGGEACPTRLWGYPRHGVVRVVGLQLDAESVAGNGDTLGQLCLKRVVIKVVAHVNAE